MIDNPLVSVVIPTYNRAAFLSDAVESVLRQTFTNYEIIVVDDGSTDGTDSLIQGYGDRLKYVRQQNRGVSVARNEGVRVSRGEYIAFLDSDDIWTPDKLACQISFLSRFPECDLLFSPAWVVNANLDRTSSQPLFGGLAVSDITLNTLYLRNIIIVITLLVRRDVFQAIGGFDPDIRYGEDWSLAIRILTRGALGAYLPEPLAYIRRHSSTQSHVPNPLQADQILADHMAVLNRCFSLYPGRVPEWLIKRSLANVCVLGSLNFLAIGRFQRSRDILSCAFNIDPALVDSMSLYGQHMVNVAIDHARDGSGALDHSKASEFIKAALTDRRLFARHQASFEKQVWSKAHLALAFDAYRRGDQLRSRVWLGRAITLDPTCLRNVGIALMTIEAFAGKPTASAVRKIGRKLLPVTEPDAFVLVDTRVQEPMD